MSEIPQNPFNNPELAQRSPEENLDRLRAEKALPTESPAKGFTLEKMQRYFGRGQEKQAPDAFQSALNEYRTRLAAIKDPREAWQVGESLSNAQYETDIPPELKQAVPAERFNEFRQTIKREATERANVVAAEMVQPYREQIAAAKNLGELYKIVGIDATGVSYFRNVDNVFARLLATFDQAHPGMRANSVVVRAELDKVFDEIFVKATRLQSQATETPVA